MTTFLMKSMLDCLAVRRTTVFDYDDAYNIIMDNAHRTDFHAVFAEPTHPPVYYLPPPPVLTPDVATPATTYRHPDPPATTYQQSDKPTYYDHAQSTKPQHPPRSLNLFAFLEGAKFESTNKVSIKLPACQYLETCKCATCHVLVSHVLNIPLTFSNTNRTNTK